jgi:hypothetical protein
MIAVTLTHVVGNERLWFTTNMRMVKMYMAAKDYQVGRQGAVSTRS